MIDCPHSTLSRLFGCLFSWYVCHHLQKVNKSSGAHFQMLFLTYYFLMFLKIQTDSIILKTDVEQFTLTTKKSLHITFTAH